MRLGSARCTALRPIDFTVRLAPSYPETMIRFLSAALTLLCSSAALEAQEATHPVTGCYELSLSQWSASWPPEWQPPRVFRLTATPAAMPGVREGDGRYAVRPEVSFPRRRGGGGSLWEGIGSDSIRVTWAGDYAGLNLHLALGGEELNGWIRGFTDVGRPASDEPRATARARRVPCPAQLEGPP